MKTFVNSFIFFFFLKALAEAIRLVTEMNPDLSVEKIEYMQEIE